MDLFGLELDLLTAAVRDIMNITAETFAASITRFGQRNGISIRMWM